MFSMSVLRRVSSSEIEAPFLETRWSIVDLDADIVIFFFFKYNFLACSLYYLYYEIGLLGGTLFSLLPGRIAVFAPSLAVHAVKNRAR
jgi:hypothetical protein